MALNKEVSYNTLHNDILHFPVGSEENNDHEDITDVIIHKVSENNRGSWTHIEDLDTFFTRMYRYYIKGGFYAMLVSDTLQLLQYCFIVYFFTFLVFCVNYPVLFRDGNISTTNINNITFADIIYPNCVQRVTFKWWLLIALCLVVGFIKLIRSTYHLFHAYDIKLFYNKGLKIKDSDLCWLSWCSIQNKVKDAQRELQMCIHKEQISELDIYHRILRFDNYMVAMVNKRLLPLYITIPWVGDVLYLSKGLKYNLELLLFYNPWSPWKNCWHLRDCYKDASKRLILAKQLENHITFLVILNVFLAPLILAWQILYFFFSYAELIKRSPESLGLRTWSVYARILLRHFNELDHELSDRLNRAHKPATKYLNSFPSPVGTIIAKNIAFFCASILGVIIAFSIYDEIVLTVEHMLSVITGLGCMLAAARSFIPEEGIRQRSSEELLIQVLQHVHYLPASWKGKAHTRTVATNFQQLFQFRAIYLLIELLSPLLCPFVLYSLKSRALDIVDFYRNFTVSVLDIGDVCSFAQMDVRQHGNPDWPASKDVHDQQSNISQYNQGEEGKTELSLVAFSCRNPNWRMPHQSQRQFIQKLQDGILDSISTGNLMNPFAYQNNLSYYYRNKHYTVGNVSVFMRSELFYNQESPIINHSEHDDEIYENEQDLITNNKNLNIIDKTDNLMREEHEMSVGTLHLYDMHIDKISQKSTRHNVSFVDNVNEASTSFHGGLNQQLIHSNEDTPLLRKIHP